MVAHSSPLVTHWWVTPGQQCFISVLAVAVGVVSVAGVSASVTKSDRCTEALNNGATAVTLR